MTSESEQPSPLEKLEAFKRHQNELDRRIHELEVVKRKLEVQLARNELNKRINNFEISMKNLQEQLTRNELNVQIDNLEISKSNLEDQLISLEARTELLEAAMEAERISQSEDFKNRFCRLYNRRLSILVNIAELVTEVLLPANLAVTIPALITIKLGKIGVEHYCNDET